MKQTPLYCHSINIFQNFLKSILIKWQQIEISTNYIFCVHITFQYFVHALRIPQYILRVCMTWQSTGHLQLYDQYIECVQQASEVQCEIYTKMFKLKKTEPKNKHCEEREDDCYTDDPSWSGWTKSFRIWASSLVQIPSYRFKK